MRKTIFHGAKVLTDYDSKNYLLVKNMNTYDTNYRFYDLVKRRCYLIDIDDISNDEYLDGLLNYKELFNIKNLEFIKEVSWKKESY